MTTAHLAVFPPAADTAPAFDVTRIVEEDLHQVELSLTDAQWRELVGDIAARVLTLRGQGRPVLTKLLAAGVRPGSMAQQDALTELVGMLKGSTHRGSAHALPPSWALTPEDATRLGCELWDAAEEPVVCGCGARVQQPTELTNTCGSCVARLGGNR
jgi:hypothetical protein